MAIQKAKQKLKKLLDDETVKVVALSGDWGTGKSHLWREVQAEAPAESRLKKALYISLFGLASAQDLKSAVVLAPAGGAFKHLMKVADKGLKRLFVSLEDEMIALSLPGTVKDRLVVLDDIERKNSKLEVDEVLGFIETLRQTYGTRFLLVLNESRLGSGSTQWSTFREKVIDEEVRLNTTPAEAVDIALQKVSSLWAEEVRSSCITCGIRNIRIVTRIIRLVNGLFTLQSGIDALVARRLVPRVVLLSAIHYEALSQVASVEEVLNFGGPGTGVDAGKSGVDDESPQAQRRAKFELLMQDLGIEFVDEFERYVVEYLEKGDLEEEKLIQLIRRYLEDTERQKAQEAVERFIDRKLWHAEISNRELLQEASALERSVGRVPPRRVTAVLELLEDMVGGASVSERLIAAWGATMKSNPPDRDQLEALRYGGPFHSGLESVLDDLESSASSMSLVEIAGYISHAGIDAAAEHVFMASTAEDYEKSIKSLSGPELLSFVKVHLSLAKGTRDDAVDRAVENFIEGCRRICADSSHTSRYPEILRRAFRAKGMEALLIPAENS